MTTDSLKQQIRIALDQNNVSTQLAAISDIDTLTIEQIIDSKLEEAARRVLLVAPYRLVGSGKKIPDETSVTWESQAGYGAGSILLPSDFLRLLYFKMSDWNQPVYQVISVDEPLYRVQQSRFGGVRGNPQRPVCAIVPGSNGLVLEFYSCTGGADVNISDARYLAIPKIVGNEIDIPPMLERAVIYKAARLVASTVGENDKAAVLEALCDENMI